MAWSEPVRSDFIDNVPVFGLEGIREYELAYLARSVIERVEAELTLLVQDPATTACVIQVGHDGTTVELFEQEFG